MKRFVGLIIIAIASILLAAPSARAEANLDNFVITNFKIDMELTRDDENRSKINVVEEITAKFPNYDQNHGLERSFVKDYDGHGTSFKLIDVTDENGKSLEHHWDGDNLKIGDKNKYVHGEKTYKITYSQRDVTKFYDDTKKSEFYWDVLGVEWRVPIENVAISVRLAGDLKDKLEGLSPFCYYGFSNSTNKCEVVVNGNNYQVNYQDIPSRSGITLAFGFSPSTFADYEPPWWGKYFFAWGTLQIILTILSIAAGVVFSFKRDRSSNRSKEVGTIAPEYLPPKKFSVTAASKVISSKKSVFSAQLVDLAVRHYIKLSETKAKTTFSPAQYSIEVIKDLTDLREEEREVLIDIFGLLPQVGSKLNLKELQNNTSYFIRTVDNESKLERLVRGGYGLFERDGRQKDWFMKLAKRLIIGSILLLSPALAVIALIARVYAVDTWRLSDSGLDLKRYLEGLKMYIKTAEEDRLKVLQSPEGAKKVREYGDMGEVKNRIVLYERLLPYAILFGNEKQWGETLGQYYESANSTPDWYRSTYDVFNAASFASGISGIGAVASSASSYSSGSGGSSGGGSAGGGGGGGGGGGW